MNTERVEGIASSQPQASKQVYRPPSARNKVITFNLHDDEEAPHKPGISRFHKYVNKNMSFSLMACNL